MILKNKLSDDEIRRVAELHHTLLSDGFLASFGKDFLYVVYKQIYLAVDATIIVYISNSEVVGFIAGGIGLKNIYMQLLKHPVQLCSCIIPKLLKMSFMVKLYASLTRKIRKNNTKSEIMDAELYSICVTKEYQGSFVAEALYDGLCEFFKHSNKDAFMIVVGSKLSRAQSFYIKQGATPIGSLEQGFGKQSIIFKQSV